MWCVFPDHISNMIKKTRMEKKMHPEVTKNDCCRTHLTLNILFIKINRNIVPHAAYTPNGRHCVPPFLSKRSNHVFFCEFITIWITMFIDVPIIT